MNMMLTTTIVRDAAAGTFGKITFLTFGTAAVIVGIGILVLFIRGFCNWK